MHIYGKCGCYHTCASSSDVQYIPRRVRIFFQDWAFIFVYGTDLPPKQPPKTSDIILTSFFWLLDTRKDAMKKTSSHNFLFAKDYQAMTSGWQGEAHSKRYGRELVSKPATSLNDNDAATVERLIIMVKLVLLPIYSAAAPVCLGIQKIYQHKMFCSPSDNVEIMFQRQSVVRFPKTDKKTISGRVFGRAQHKTLTKKQNCRHGLGFSRMSGSFRTKFKITALGSPPHALLQQ